MKSILWMLWCLVLAGCAGKEPEADHGHDHEEEGWAITAWGDQFEIFAECEPLEVGHSAHAFTHVTRLSDFSPLRAGAVSVIFRRPDGGSAFFRQVELARDGIFRVQMRPTEAGEFSVSFLVESTNGNEEIPAGTVRVGGAGSGGGLIGLAALAAGEGPQLEAASREAAISFLKEQQWRTAFATAWSRQGALRTSVRGPGTVRIAAGSEAILSAPLDGVVDAGSAIPAGLVVNRGQVLARLSPRATSSRMLQELEAEAKAAEARLERLEKLHESQAVSLAEVEAARARVASLNPQLDAALGRRGAKSVEVAAPFSGQVAEVRITPGQAVSAGEMLVRLVRTAPVWVEIRLTPGDALRVQEGTAGLSLNVSGAAPVLIEAADVRLVAQAPEVDAGTGTVSTIFEIRRAIPVRAGTVVEAEVLLAEEIRGVVVPAASLIDDGGVHVIYTQASGEAFRRHEVTVGGHQGDQALVNGLSEGLRIVTQGGAAIRRATLMQSGSIEGHVH
ncbi:MAG: efflux RND transporter periplasmic adaptor subunit [Candidatus Eisenbacteria bacterium]|nr:efflux RND transporter periplasmic adaptor subunit [Candidatus Eisenbacteria bacterium]